MMEFGLTATKFVKCKYGFYTCSFKGQVSFCNECDEGQNYQMKEETRGGKREGAGQKPKFKGNEETTTIAFRVPVSKKAEIKDKVDKLLEKYVVKKK